MIIIAPPSGSTGTEASLILRVVGLGSQSFSKSGYSHFNIDIDLPPVGCAKGSKPGFTPDDPKEKEIRGASEHYGLKSRRA